MEVLAMLKRMLVIGALVAVSGCSCLPCLPNIPKCWICGVGEALADTIFGPEGVVGSLITSLIGGLVPTT